MRFLAILMFVAVYLQACCKAECINGELIASFENFRAIDIDTVILIKYQRGTQQQTGLDTSYRVRNVSSIDTFRTYHIEQLFYPYDWKIIIPSINKHYTASDFELKTVKCCGEKAKRVVSYKLNNVQQQGDFLRLQ